MSVSAKITLGSTLGGLVLLIIIGVVVIIGSKSNEEAALAAKNDSAAARLQSEQNNKDIKQINATLHHFINMWTERIKIGNTNTNNTQDLIVKTQQNILGNLSGHRYVTNETFESIKNILNTTSALTGPEYEKLADKRVESIVANLSEEHELIFKALNITKTEIDSESKQFGQLLKEFIESNKEKAHEPQRPKVK